MKELSIEEKAKAYDMAIERAKKWYNAPNIDKMLTYGNKVIEEIFPELVESEDEKIRNQIIEHIKWSYDEQECAEEEMHRWLSWLEKQSTPQVRTGIEWVNTIDDACDKRYSEEYAHGEYCHEQSFKWGFQEGVDWLEKQSEQKPFDYENVNIQQKDFAPKVEPRFHEGQWITNGDYTWKIVEVKPLDYILQSQDGNIVDDTISHVDEQFHSFTIKDAKDGDVLFCRGNIKNSNGIKYERICLFNNLDNAFFTLTKTSNFVEDYDIDVNIDYPENTVPATKEQRDLLFQKMKEAGYEWDAEKKELKKIEPFDEYEGLTDFERTLADICIGWIGEEIGWKQYIKDNADVLLKIAIKKFNSIQDAPFEQKPAWSEKDEDKNESLT